MQQPTQAAAKAETSSSQNVTFNSQVPQQSLGDVVRDKAVAILGLALTSPSDLSPHEAAVALEAAVFAAFSEHGYAGMRFVNDCFLIICLCWQLFFDKLFA